GTLKTFLTAAVAVGVIEAGDGRARHQEGFESALVDDGDRAGLDAFVIVFVPAVEIDAGDFAARGVEDDGEEIGEYLAVDALGEGLAFALILLAVAFDAVSEDLVEEDAGGASGKDGGADEG